MSSERALYTVNKFFPGVKQVKDAIVPLTINVLASDASHAAVKSHKACAAAVACKRQYHLDGVIISRAIAYTIKGTLATRYVVPEDLTREVVAFDRGGKFEPGEYRLQVPDKHIKLGTPRTHRSGGWKPAKNSVPRHVTTNIRAVLGGKRPTK